jgi:anti-sigma regulatory factor (Ser/Thr protein kinase)
MTVPRPLEHQMLYERSLPAEPANVGSLRRELDAALVPLRLSAQQRGDIGLVVSEALTNAAMHAYVGQAVGSVTLAASTARKSLHVTITDEGRGMIPRNDSPGVGLGVSVMGRLADGLEISTPGAGGTEVCARFSL